MTDLGRGSNPTARESGEPSIPVVVYDACVLYPSFLRDVLLRVAAADLVACRWTDEIQIEWTRNLQRDRPNSDPMRVAATRAKMEKVFPSARVENYQRHIERLTNHRKDRHVLAAAIESGASQIITANLKDFPAHALSPDNVIAVAPDEFLINLYVDDPETVALTLNRHRVGLQKPALSAGDYVETCKRNQLVRLAGVLEADHRL